VNGTLLSAFSNIAANVSDPAIPLAPTTFRVSVGAVPVANTATLSWQSATNPTSFTIVRASNATFTKGLNTTTVAGTLRTATQTLNAGSTYYYRIRANNSTGGSSAWTNASPFPVKP
jgi:predicted phage tail protein